MPATFWNGWQLWEKMCFVLGCAIVLVICGGCVKLVYNHYRIRKYTQLAAEKAQIRHQLQRTASVNHGRGKEVPFGVRALESGIEVDGVWISGSNTPAGSTPAHSAPGSPTLDAMTENSSVVSHEKIASDRASLPSQITRIEIPQPAYGHDAARISLPSPGNGRPTYQPRRSSGLRFSDSHELYINELGDQAAALAALEGRSIGFGPAAEVHAAHRRSKSWATTSWNESYDPASESSQAASNRALLHPWHAPSNRLAGFPSLKGSTQPEDCDDNRTVPGLEKTSAVYGPSSSHSPLSYEDLPDEHSHQNTPRQENRFRLSDGSEVSITPVKIELPSRGQGADAEHVGSHEAVLTRPPEVDDIDDATFHNVPPEKTLVHYPHETIEQPRRSQVIRKINSGFEILRPGTLSQPRQRSEIVLGAAIGAAEQSSKRVSRRLHRRRGDLNLGKM